MTAGFLFEAKNPYFRWKNRFSSDIDLDTVYDNLTPDYFVTSDVSRLKAKFTHVVFRQRDEVAVSADGEGLPPR